MPSFARRLRKLAGVLTLLSLSACGTLSRMEVDGDGAVTRRLDRGNLRAEVDALALPMVTAGVTPGLVVGVLLPDGSRQVFGYGITGGDDSRRPDGDTLFAVGSVSKGFLAATAAVLVQEGRLSWDDTLEKLLPPGTPLSAPARRITLLQLATHTSGLPRQPWTPRTLAYLIEYLFDGENFYRHFDRAYLLDYLADVDAPATPEPRYSNIGYGLFAYALECATGRPIELLVREKILAPLGLADTGYVGAGTPVVLPHYAQRAHGHAGDQPAFIRRGAEVPDWRFTEVLTASAALYSTADDLLSYAAAHLRGSGDVLLDRALRDTLTVRYARPREAAALAWIVDDIGGRRLTYQVGFVAGYSSYIGMDVDHGTAVVVLQNSFNWTNGIGHRLLLRLSPP
jgi:CubicO group peptidase (beta-lactamase class C family)